MSNFKLFCQDESGIEIVINPDTEEAYTTVSGYAKLSGKDYSTIDRRIVTMATDEQIEAEVETARGLKSVVLLPTALVLKWLVGDRPQLSSKMREANATFYLHNIAGFESKFK